MKKPTTSRRPVPPFRVHAMVSGLDMVSRMDLDYFRQVALGVRRYGFSTGRLVFTDRWLGPEIENGLEARVRSEGIQGIVAALHDSEMERRYAALNVPVVNISNSTLKPLVPVVTQDDEGVGRLAAAHLLACGCRAFGFWGQAERSYAIERRAGFSAALAASGKSAVMAEAFNGPETTGELYARMRTWLAAQARPLGVFAVLDTYALLLIRAARDMGWRVPEDVAVLGAGDDDFWVEFESTPLSSVRLPARQIGYEAAALLDRMITQGVRRAEGRRLPVSEIAERKSTDVIYIEDGAVAKAAKFIREHAEGNPYVGDVVKAAGVSRSALQARFRAAMGRTILDEIQRVRVSRAQALLANTDLKLAMVAERCGFPNSQRFSVLFRQVAGLSPSEYRRQFREG
ncbi:MAG: substrate-binding domain-containing protein [Opitutaceae bacterium]